MIKDLPEQAVTPTHDRALPGVPERLPAATAATRARPPRPPIALVAAALLAIAIAALLILRNWQAAGSIHALTASGTLEADETLISPQVSGAISALPAPEGSKVTAGAIVARIDDRLIQLQMQEADVGSRRQLELQQEYYILRSPIAGLVTRVPARVGETAMPGQVLLAIAPTDRLKLTLYVREAELARVSVGQQITVTADPFPNRSFGGTVTSINSQAEFTPRNVQTQTDRLNLVFGVQAFVSNPDGALKPGMPADASFEPIRDT